MILLEAISSSALLQRAPQDSRLCCLAGNAQLLAIAQVDVDAALALKVALDCFEDADFSGAEVALEAATQRARQLDLDTRCDAAGTLTPRRQDAKGGAPV